jgi:hypothetical protein
LGRPVGEKIVTLASGKFKDNVIDIELNYPPAPGLKRQVHIQSASFRLEFAEDEYLQLSTAVLVVAENLRRLKGFK